MLSRYTFGELSRRQLIKAIGLSGVGLSLPSLLQRKAAASVPRSGATDTAVIFIQLGGGASQFETYDPKPDAPLEYRGPTRPIATSVPGIWFCELFPRQAALMDKLAIVRSVGHEQASHIALHLIETGYGLRNPANGLRGEMPSVGSITSRARVGVKADLPAYISLPKAQAYSSPPYVGARFDAFNINEDPSLAGFRIQSTTIDPRISEDRLRGRKQLWSSLNQATWSSTPTGPAQAVDDFTQQAFDLLMGDRMQLAVRLEQEASPTRDAYGRNVFGQRLLLARRLAEAGVPFVMVRTFDWDDHDALDARMRARAPGLRSGAGCTGQRPACAWPESSCVDRRNGRIRPHAARELKGWPRPLAGRDECSGRRRRFSYGPGRRSVRCQRGWRRRSSLPAGERLGDGLSASWYRSCFNL